MLREYLSNIADKFRTYLDTTEPINAQDFAGKVEDVAVRYNQLGFASGREVGYNQGLEECQSKHYVGAVMGSGTNTISCNVPFEPDIITITGHSAHSYALLNNYIQLAIETKKCCRYVGSLKCRKDGPTTIIDLGINYVKRNTSYIDGVFTFTEPNYKLPFDENTIYEVVAVKNGKTAKQNTITEINNLPNESSGTNLLYSKEAINATFTTEEWESLIATKPNWTFALV